MSDIKPIQINPELFKLPSNNKNKTLKNKSTNDINPKLLKKDLLARIKNHRSNSQNYLQQSKYDNNIHNNTNQLDSTLKNKSENKSENLIKNAEAIQSKITLENNTNIKKNIIDSDDDFMQSINFLKALSNKKNNSIKKSNNFPLKKNIDTIDNSNHIDTIDTIDNSNHIDNSNDKLPKFGCLKNGILPTFREYSNKTIKKYNEDSNDSINLSPKKKSVSFKYNLGKKHKVISVLIKNNHTRKKITSEHQKLKETKINDMKNYLKRHNLLKSGSNAPTDVIKKIYEQALLSGDIRNTNKKSIVHNYLS